MELRFWLDLITSISALSAAIGVFLLYKQFSLQKDIAKADLLMRIDEIFYSDKFTNIRMSVVNKNRDDINEMSGCEDILDLFEKIAHLKKTNVLDLLSIYEMWGYWIIRYWIMSKPYIEEYYRKESDKSYYLLTEELIDELVKLEDKSKKRACKISKKFPSKKAVVIMKEIEKKDMNKFIEQEKDLVY